MALTNKSQQNTVFGKVTDANGHPIRNHKVEIFDVCMWVNS